MWEFFPKLEPLPWQQYTAHQSSCLEQAVPRIRRQLYKIEEDSYAEYKLMYWGSRLIATIAKRLYEAIKLTKYVCQPTGKPTYRLTDLNKVPNLKYFFIMKRIAAS